MELLVGLLASTEADQSLDRYRSTAYRRQIKAIRAWTDLGRFMIRESGDHPFCDLLRCCKCAGATDQQIAKLLDISPTAMQRWLNGMHIPALSFRLRIGNEVILPFLDQLDREAIRTYA